MASGTARTGRLITGFRRSQGLAVDPAATAARLVGSRPSRRDYTERRMLAGADLTAIVLAQAAGLFIVSEPHPWKHLLSSLVMLPIWLLVFRGYGLYDRDSKRVSHRTIDDLPWLFHGVLVSVALLWAWFRITPTSPVRFVHLTVIGGVALVLTLVGREFARWLVHRLLGPERVLVVGDEKLTTLLVRKMRHHPEYGLHPVGTLALEDDADSRTSLPVLGSLAPSELSRVIQGEQIDRVLVSHTELEEGDLVAVLHLCRRLGVKLTVLPRLFDALGPSVALDDVEGITVLGINPPVLGRSSRVLKRTLDIVVAFVVLVLIAPLLVAIAIAIKLDSPGPVLFRQQRIGRGGRSFWLVKFRTMRPDAEQMTAALLGESLDPNWLKLDYDPRITRIGRTLRMTSLDELPQLWNVLKGEMSLVGPRPLVEREAHQLEDWAWARIDLTPGLTGLWQVLGRTNIPFAEMAKLDYVYVTNWTLWGDIRLLVKTLPVVLLRRGAN